MNLENDPYGVRADR